MAKKKETPKDKPKGMPATEGLEKRLKTPKAPKAFIPTETQRVAVAYIERRQDEMANFRRGLSIEQKWQEADEEYVPHELDFGTTRKRFETDQDTGLRSRMVPVGDVTQQWRQASSAPTLLVKIQTAISLLVGQMPEADLIPLTKKFEATTDLAYALWKRSWSITNAREKLKLVLFDLMKYGWAPMRTAPRTVKYPKRVLVSKDTENPENDRYEEKDLTWFNDVDRERLSPYTTWIDEMAKPYDPYTTNEAYTEIDMSYDEAKVLFKDYPNFDFVPKNSIMVRNTDKRKTNRQDPNEKMKSRQDIVTIGYFESRHKDMYCIFAPACKVPIYLSPLPNDDGYLSINHTLWLLRKSDLPYGISMWEVIRQNKTLFDKMKNMGMDQLVLSIMKFGFFSGTNTAVGDGKIEIVPGQARQLTSSTGKPEVNWMEIPGPGEEFWKGVEAIQGMIDTDSGISPSLEGNTPPGPQTLGEILHNREDALKRLNTPVDNVAYLLDQDAYLTLSWASQIYSVPNIIEFDSLEDVQAYNKENGVNHYKLFGEKQDDGTFKGPYDAHYLPELALHLEDGEGQLKRSKESKFYQVGDQKGQINPKDLKWRGVFKTRPRSIIDSSQELAKASKMELANVLLPLFDQPPEVVAKAVEQIVKINEEDPKDWLPDNFLQYLKDPEGYAKQQAQKSGPNEKVMESMNYKDVPPDIQRQMEAAAGFRPSGAGAQPGATPPAGGGVPVGGGTPGGGAPASIFTKAKAGEGNSTTMKGNKGLEAKKLQTVVPRSEVAKGNKRTGIFEKRL
jgi:hypothetical protein